MRSKEDLHHLIQAMSKSEKRYFVLDAKKSGRSASRYLSLFETINAMEEYDEETLKKKFPKNLSSDKAYLYEAILRSMRDYRSKSSKAAQVKERLMDAKYLYERGLYQQSGDRIMEAKALAKELEDNFSLLEIIKEEQLSLYDRRVRVDIEQLEKLENEKTVVLEAVIEEQNYLDLYFKLLVELYREGILKDSESIENLKERIPIKLLEQRSLPNSATAQRRFYLSSANYYRLLGDIDKIYESYVKVINWWNEHPALKDEEFFRYIADIGNLVNTCYKSEKLFPEAQKWIIELKTEEHGRTYHEKKHIFLSLSLSNLLHFLNANDFVSAKAVMPEIISGLEEFGLKKSVLLLANIATAFFLIGDYNNCIKWSNILLALKSGSREEINRILRIYKIISMYELGKIDELESSVRIADRANKKFKLPAKRFENEILNHYLKKIFNAPLNEVKHTIYEFKEYLNTIAQTTGKEKPIGLGELQLWVKKKQ